MLCCFSSQFSTIDGFKNCLPQHINVFQFISVYLSLVLVCSAGVRLTITPVQGTTLIISQSSEVSRRSACTICNGTDLKRTCSSSGIILTNPKAAESVEFTCPKPEEVFTVTVSDTGTLPLQKFNRTFIWNLKAPVSRAFHLNFNQMGLRQIHPSEQCPDQHTYTLLAHQDTGEAAIGTYCRNGSVSGAQVLNQGRFSLEIPGGWKLKPTVFNVSVGEEIKSLAVLKVILPEGTSSSMFLSPNYPDSFPDDDQVEWEFMVPPKHNTTVLFLNSTQPQCLKKEPAVEYHYGNMPFAVVKKLSDPQPTQRRESFSMILRNCEMNKIGISSNGLSVRFQVSANLRKGTGLVSRVKDPKSNCELKLNSFIQENITIPSGKISQLSFQDCPRQKLILTASRIIECHQWKDCPAATAPIPLTVPVLESCLPAHLANIDWTLRPPQQGTVELLPLNGSLRQSLPGHKCYGPDIIIVDDEEHGTTVGQFCPQGAISKIQVQTKVTDCSIILHLMYTERYIFTVRPKSGFPTILATPSWPMGMKSFSTVSWIVSVPSNKEAHLLFTNISQPKCSKQHTSIRVQSLGSLKEMYSQQEDKKADREITISESFYLNMSNCMPEKGDFSVLTEITLLHKDNPKGFTLTVARKRKGQLSHQVSVYNPNGTNFLPGHNRSYPKSGRDDQDESPIYACIDETLVYSHLLLDRVELGVRDLPVDVYHSFTGPTEDNALSLGTVADIPEVGIYQPFVPPSGVSPHTHNGPLSQELSMVNNELYGGIHSQSQPENMFTKQAPMLELEAEDLNGEQR
uniref:CUB domain containing protein 1a n=1 Tax=Esox lucius TaxID=8010 RepID=A0A3P9AQG2_ESOLU